MPAVDDSVKFSMSGFDETISLDVIRKELEQARKSMMRSGKGFGDTIPERNEEGGSKNSSIRYYRSESDEDGP